MPLHDAAEKRVLHAEIRLFAIELGTAVAGAQDQLRGVFAAEEDRAKSRLHQAKGLDGDLLQDFIEIRFGNDHLGDVDQTGELPALEAQLIDFPGQIQPLGGFRGHVDEARLVGGAEGVGLGRIDIEQSHHLPAHFHGDGHFGTHLGADGHVTLFLADIAGAQGHARGDDPAGDAFARAELDPLGPFAQAVAGLDVEQAGVRVDQDEGAGIGAGGAHSGGKDALKRFLRVKQRAQVGTAQLGKKSGLFHFAMRLRTSSVRAVRTSSDSIFFPSRSAKIKGVERCAFFRGDAGGGEVEALVGDRAGDAVEQAGIVGGLDVEQRVGARGPLVDGDLGGQSRRNRKWSKARLGHFLGERGVEVELVGAHGLVENFFKGGAIPRVGDSFNRSVAT